MTPILDVLDGGLLTTVQDAGRPDWAHVGVPESGAADPMSLAIANLLAGNAVDAATLELTLVGPTLAIRRPVTIALAGADLGGRLRGGRRLATGRAHRLEAGDVIEFPGGDPETATTTGARAYLAIPGGVDVPIVLGSRSTCLAGGFGGLDGRALRPGDSVAAGGDDRPNGHRSELAWPDEDWPRADAGASVDVRVLGGPDADDLLDALTSREWHVGTAADRVGLRLECDSLPDDLGGEALTSGVAWGTIQLPPDGRPIVLGPDHQTTGGYRIVGVVPVADRPVLGQLRPGATVRFVATDRAAALAALRAQRDVLDAGAAAIRDAEAWHALAHAAGG